MLKITGRDSIESCAVCQKANVRGIYIADKRRSREMSSYLEVCEACVRTFEKKFQKAKTELRLYPSKADCEEGGQP